MLKVKQMNIQNQWVSKKMSHLCVPERLTLLSLWLQGLLSEGYVAEAAEPFIIAMCPLLHLFDLFTYSCFPPQPPAISITKACTKTPRHKFRQFQMKCSIVTGACQHKSSKCWNIMKLFLCPPPIYLWRSISVQINTPLPLTLNFIHDHTVTMESLLVVQCKSYLMCKFQRLGITA